MEAAGAAGAGGCRGRWLPGLLGRRRPEMIARLRGLGAATGGWRLRLGDRWLAMEAAGAAVGGSGGSELTRNGSHLVAAGFSDKPRRSCDGGPQRAVQNQASCCTGRPRRTVLYRKRPCGVREVHLSAGPHAAVAAAQVRRKAGRPVTSDWRLRATGGWRPHDGEGAHDGEDANRTTQKHTVSGGR